MKRQLFTAVAIIMLCLAALPGCNNGDGNNGAQSPAGSGGASPGGTSASGGAQASGGEEEPGSGFMLTGAPATLTYMKGIWPDDLTVISEWNDNLAYKKAEELTGVKIDFQEIPFSDYSSAFAVVWASGAQPDMMEVNLQLTSYPGGWDRAVDDGAALDLYPLLDELAPNYQRHRDMYDNIRRLTMTDRRRVPGFYTIETDNWQKMGTGLVIRKDWLDDLGLDAPTTLDELHNVLKLFKTEKKARIPMVLWDFVRNDMIAPFEFNDDWLPSLMGAQLDPKNPGRVAYGLATDGVREYASLMKTWYDEGLLGEAGFYRDHNGEAVKGDCGVWTQGFYSIASNIMASMSDPNAIVEGIPHPLTPAGTRGRLMVNWDASFGVLPNILIINPKNDNWELAVKWADFWYSDFGTQLANFGVEGVSFEFDAGGIPRYTDVMAPTEMESFTQKQSKYFFHSGAYVRREAGGQGEAAKYYAIYEQRAQKTFQDSLGTELNLPALTLTLEEETEARAIWNDMRAYANATIPLFIRGEIPIEGGWDTYQSELKSKGLARYCEIFQAAYDRYLVR